MNIASSIIDLIGNTPLVELQRLGKGLPGRVAAKLEFFNPGSSVKDRIAISMLEAAEKAGKINEKTIIVEATSGNTGIGVAMAGAALGFKVVLVMPETMSIERRKLQAAFGAQFVLTEGAKGMKGAIEKANELVREKGYVMLSQFENKFNPQAHELTTAKEIMDDFKELDAFVAGVGTGGTLSGVAKALKANGYNTKIIAVEPNDSAVISGEKPGPHKIQGIGAGFIPATLDTSYIDEIERAENDEAFDAARKLAKEEGVLLGISGGAALAAAIKVAKRLGKGKKVLFVAPDNGERYLSTALYEA